MEANSGGVAAGKKLFEEACAPCHGQKATGIEGIGVDLKDSKFVAGLDTDQLTSFLIIGLSINNPLNRSKIRMPPRAGRPDLSDEDMRNIALYNQSINTQEFGSQKAAAYMKWLENGGQEEIEAMPEVGQEGLTGAALDGQTPYLRYCAVCHGPNAEGIESLGKGFRGRDFIRDASDEELIELIRVGRKADDPLNDTGIEMLPYGGQKTLSDEDLTNLVAYIRAMSALEVNSSPVPSDINNETTHTDTAASNGGGQSTQDESTQQNDQPSKDKADTEQAAEEQHHEDEAAAFAIIDSITPKCFVCHRISDRGNKNGPGPDLNGLKDHAGSRISGMSAEEYVKQSILDPGAFIVEECPRGPCVDVMVKNFREKITDEQLDILVPFLLSLEPDT